MTYGLIIPACGIIYILVLIMVYFSKKNYKRIQSKLYRLMFIPVLSYFIFQIISVVILNTINDYYLVFVTWRICWASCISWYGFYYFYFIAFIRNDESTSLINFIKSSKYNIIMFFVFVLGILGYIFILPYAGLDPNNMTYLPGSTSYIVFVFCLIINVFIAIGVFKNNSLISVRDKIVILFISLVSTLTIMAIQIWYQSASIIPIAFAIEMYLLYFTIEDPNILILKETTKAKIEIEKLNKAKTDFLYSVSYEIKNPMNSIVNTTDTLLGIPYSRNESEELLKQLSSSANLLLENVNNVIDLSTIEIGNTIVKNKNYNSYELIEKLTNTTRDKITNENIEFNVKLDKNIPSILYGDESKIYQSVLNVLINAAKYTNVGKIDFIVSSKKSEEAEILIFKISDTGMGIKEEDKEKIYDEYNRAEDAIETEQNGVGLGLTITKKYLDLINGNIWFNSVYFAGSTFVIEIPQKVIDPTPINKETVKITDENNLLKDLSKYRILIVDDNKLNLRVLEKLLEKYKLKIDVATSGNECISKIKLDEKYDIIFMDDNMPDISGVETYNVLKELTDYEIPPIVILTANAISGMKNQYLNIGFSDYLTKPIEINELDRIINKFLNK